MQSDCTDARGGVKKALSAWPELSDIGGQDTIFKMDALISHYLHIPFPEQLSEEEWVMAWRKTQWLTKFKAKQSQLKPGENLSL